MAQPILMSSGTGEYVASEDHVAHRGPRQKPLEKRGLIVHGGWGQRGLDGVVPDMVERVMCDDGVPVLFADFSDGKTWGNATGQSRMDSAWTFLKSRCGAKTDKVVLYGASMGAMVCLRWALTNPTKVAAILGVIPANNLVDLHDSAPGVTAPQKTDMETKLGISGTYAGNGSITAIDPAQNAASYAGIPILFFYSGNDTTVQPATVTSFCAGVGASATAVNMGNFGHGAATGTAGDAVYAQAVQFLERYTQ